MAQPITTGTLRTKVSDMLIGDYIAVRYTTTAHNKIGYYSELGTVDTDTVPELDRQYTAAQLDGYIYLILVDKGLLVPNYRNVLTDSLGGAELYNMLNKENLIQGKVVSGLDDENTTFVMRVPRMEEVTLFSGTNLNGTVNTNDIYTNFVGHVHRYETVSDNYNNAACAYADFNTIPAGFSYTTGGNLRTRLLLEFVTDEDTLFR